MSQQAPDERSGDSADPAMERVRRKLVRFMAFNLGFLGLALMAVLAVIVYRSMTPSPGDVAAPASGEMMTGEIALPAGARVLSHTLSGNRIALDAELADGSRTLFVYDMAEGRMIGRFAVTAD